MGQLEQAIDLNVRHQQIQSIDLKQHHSNEAAGQKRYGDKRCERSRIVAGALVLLLPFGAHRWYVPSLRINAPDTQINGLCICLDIFFLLNWNS